MEMRNWTDGLSIREVELTSLADWPSKPLDLAEPGNRAYLLTGAGWRGYVLGGLVETSEDDGNPKDRSPQLGPLSD